MECVDVCEGMAGGVVLLVIAGNPLTGVDMQLYLAVVEKESNGENPRVGEIINLSLVVSEEVGVALMDVVVTTPPLCLSVCMSVCLYVCLSVYLLAVGWSRTAGEVPCAPEWAWQGCAHVCSRQHVAV